MKLSKNYKEVDMEDNLSKALNLFNHSKDIVFVTDSKGIYKGVLTHKCLLKTKLDKENTKVKRLMVSAPKAEEGWDDEKIIRIMLENDMLTLPVIQEEKIKGVFKADDIISSMSKKGYLDSKISGLVKKDLIFSSSKKKISEVMRIFRKNNISRTPIMHNDSVIGMVTSYDLTHFDNQRKRQGYSYFMDEKNSLLNSPVENIMSQNLVFVEKKDTIKDALSMMSQNDTSSVLIKGDYSDFIGLVTKKDILRGYITQS